MEQTVNTFSKGLLMDTNPMVLGNDTLTNALNATFITMNSNEVILQNDMGNRRVDSAFLPAGYEPVGIKEYGGIIYIASYNPITNKCLIGSFPSPQMNYGKEDDISSNVDENLFNLYFTESDFGRIQFLKNFSILSPFRKKDSTKDEILHGGDKFCVYFSEDISFREKISYFDNEINKTNELEKLITNYNNIHEESGKVYSPKNKKYTLSLGVMNSLNQFTDFTSSLLRWNKHDEIIEFDSNIPDYIKFNTGYFIPKSFNLDDLGETINDAAFIRNRLKLPANTYIYKLAGPLYIKKDLNVISNMTFNYYGSEINNSENDSDVDIKYKISLDVFYEYNCPDFLTFNNNLYNDDKYFTYENNPDDINKCFIGSNIKLAKYEENKIVDWEDNTENWRTITDTIDNNCEIIYNPITNTYKIKKHYDSDTIIKKGDKYLLRIVPFTSYGYGIRNLSRLILIDYDKLKTNELSISDFRFKRNGNQMEFCLGFTGYMAGIGGINNVKMEIISGDESSVIASNYIGDFLNVGIIGINTFNIPFNEAFKERKIYLVKISWDIDNSVTPLEAASRVINFYEDEEDEEESESTSSTNNTISTLVEYRWVVTTDLFNNFYEGDDIVMDYGNSNTYNSKFKEVLKVKPKVTEISRGEPSSEVNVINEKVGIYSSNINSKNKQINYVQIGKCRLNEKKIKLELSDLYPEEITATFSYANKNNIGISAIYKNDEVETEIRINNLDSYSNSEFGLRLYNDKITTGFNGDKLNITNDNENNCLVINYEGEFLIKEYSKGIFGTEKVATNVLNVFRSIFETELTEEKLFDLCGAVEIYHSWLHTYDAGDPKRKMTIFSFQNKDSNSTDNSSDAPNNILTSSQRNEPNLGTYTSGDVAYVDSTYNHTIINYPNNIKNDRLIYNVNDINNVLNDEYFRTYTNSYPNNKYFKFLNKNFIVGTTMLRIITSFNAENSPLEYEQFSYNLRPIVLWMRTGSYSNNDWAMLPLVDTKGLIKELDYDNMNDRTTNEVLVSRIGEDLAKKFGYLGDNYSFLLNNIRYGRLTDKNYGNKLVLEYLKRRIKNFYYKSNIQNEVALFYKINQLKHIYYFDDELKLIPNLEIEINRNITEDLSSSLKNNGITQVFKIDINEVTKENISDEGLNIVFRTRKPEVEILEDTINSNNNILEYALCENGEYYIDLGGKEFEEGDINKIIVKNKNGTFEKLTDNLIDQSKSGKIGEDYYFPYIIPSYNTPSGIGTILTYRNDEFLNPISEECKSDYMYLTFDFESYIDTDGKTKLRLKSSNSNNFPPTIPQSLLNILPSYEYI